MPPQEFNTVFNKVLAYTKNEDWRVREIAQSDTLSLYFSNIFHIKHLQYTIFLEFLNDPVRENIIMATDSLKFIAPLMSEAQINDVIKTLQTALENETDKESIVSYSSIKGMISLIFSCRYTIPSKIIIRMEASIALLHLPL